MIPCYNFKPWPEYMSFWWQAEADPMEYVRKKEIEDEVSGGRVVSGVR